MPQRPLQAFRSIGRLILPMTLAAACADGTATSPLVPARASSATTPSTTATVSVVMSGLDNPRGLGFAPNGALYVTEAGNTTVNGACLTTPRGEICFSGTGAVTRLWKGQQSRVISGLPSAVFPATSEVTGPQDIGFRGAARAFVTIGWGGDPRGRSALGPNGLKLGNLFSFDLSGHSNYVADIGAFEVANNPAGGPIDSNPFGLLTEPTEQFVTDAGGNALLRVSDGAVSTVATFGPIPVPAGPFNPPFTQSDPVPTRVSRGPDGALYVSVLTGVPFLPGAASIYRVVPGQAPTVFAGGFTTITDHAWDRGGSLYVLQFASQPFLGGPGSVVRVDPNGTRTVIIATLTNPTGIAIGHDGGIFVANKGTQAGTGEVLRITP
ncbi:MAG: ScyD/ScyE family protein [Gemmatimonadaceae bacterium]